MPSTFAPYGASQIIALTASDQVIALPALPAENPLIALVALQPDMADLYVKLGNSGVTGSSTTSMRIKAGSVAEPLYVGVGASETHLSIFCADGPIGSVVLTPGRMLEGVATTVIADNAVTNAKLADMAQSTIKGRAEEAGTGNPTDLTPAQVREVAGLASSDSAAFVNQTLTGYLDLTEIAEPSSPAANVARVRAIDEGGVTTVGHKDSAGNIVPWSHYLQAGTGAALRTVRAKLRDTISVKDFGATGNGSTDDTAAIQAAIDYAESITLVTVPGAAVFFPSSRYLVTAPLTVQESGVYLLGEGRDSTVLVRDHDAGATIKFSRNTSTAIQGVGIKNMWLIDSDDSMTVGNSPFHLVFDNVDRLHMSDILFSQGAGGFVLSRVVGAEISNISMSLPTGTTTSRRGILVTSTAIGGVSVAWGSGIFMNNIEILAGTGVVSTTTLDWGLDILTVDGFWINNFHVYNTTLANIRIRREGSDACGNIYMTNIMSDHSAGHGILIDGAAVPQRVQIQGTCSGLGSTAATSRGLQIVGPILDAVFELSVDGYDSDGLYLDNASATDVVFRCGSVRGNDADSGGTAGGGLYIKQATRVSVIGGTFGGTGVEDWGIRIGDGARNVSVVGATCRDNAGAGIQIDSGADEITVVGNTLTGNGGGAIADNSIATRLIANNLGQETYGTVTQATSKTTGVTLNTTTGQITMNGAALAAATIVNFVVTNSQFLDNDIIVVNHKAGGVTFGGYTINARSVADGSFAIDVRNNTGGSLSEAIVIGFRILRKVFA